MSEAGRAWDGAAGHGKDDQITSVVVGTKHRGQEAIDAIAKMRAGDKVRLEREPTNPYDRYAVRCYFLGVFVGFIPKTVNPRIAPQMDAGAITTAVVQEPPVVRRGNFIQVEPKLRITLGEPQQ